MQAISASWPQVRALFEQALPLDLAARHVLLAQPGLAPALVAEVQSLLAHEALLAAPSGDADAPGFLSQAAVAAGSAPAGSADPAPDRTGQRLGAWCITGRLGSGGMGDVWLAERADGAYAGQAAIKLLKRGMDSSAVLARFALEQQALARLQHPHIAHLLDAGRSADELPYFVMEFVQGRPIDKACAGLPLDARLRLFLQLADAVAHAHRNLLVHRDLKPGNVLVTADGQVKLLDFGIAKALAMDDTGGDAGSEATLLGPRPFTPQYASPEQVRGEPVTTATDVYSLGVLLYVMLTGRRPYGRTATSAMAMARSVLDEEPTRPSALPVPDVAPGAAAQSARLTPNSASDSASNSASNPAADLATEGPQWLATPKRLRGDLDNVLLKALDKTIARRYGSVDAFAGDVRHFLGGYPVSARAPSPGYLARKFVARNRVAVSAAALAVLALLGGLGATAWQVHQTELQRQAAERRFDQVRLLANRLLFDYHDAIQLLPGSTAVRGRMLTDARTHLESLSKEAAGQPALQRELGVAYRRLGELYHAESRPALGDVQGSLDTIRAGLALLEQAHAAEPRNEATQYQLALAQTGLSRSLRSSGDPRGALAQLEQAALLFNALAQAHPQDTAYRVEQVRSQLWLSEVYAGSSAPELGNRALADQHLQRAVALVAPLYAQLPGDADVVALYGTVQNARWLDDFAQGRIEQGLAVLRDLDTVFARLLQLEPDNALHRRDAAVNHLSQGTALMRLQRWADARAASGEALARMQALASADPLNHVVTRDVAKLQTDVAWSTFKLGDTRIAAEQLALAVGTLETLAKADAKDRRVARLLALAHAARAEVQGAAGHAADVARHTERALTLARAQADSGNSGTALLATVQTQAGSAWAALPGHAVKACGLHRAAVGTWLGLQQAGSLRVADQPRLAQAQAGSAAACTG